MDEDVLGERKVGGHQEGGPEDGVEAQDVLGDEVKAGGPEGLRQLALSERRPGGSGRVGERGVVVEKRVEPDVEDVLGIPRHGHAPGELVAREGDVVQPGADEGERLVVAGAG